MQSAKFWIIRLYLHFIGTLAQPVQSACLTRMRSLVRIQYVPPQNQPLTINFGVAFFIVE